MESFSMINGRKTEKGQVLSEYALMLVMCAVIAISLLVLLSAVVSYGTRLINLVSWEPNPPSRSQMENIVKGNF